MRTETAVETRASSREQSDAEGSEQAVLVCGLGQLGRAVLVALRGYRVPVRTVELLPGDELDDAVEGREQRGEARGPRELRDVVSITRGDFRNPDVLRAAGIAECRSILLLAGDPKVNMQGAITARHLHPRIRVVVRADEQSRYALLRASLGTIVAYEPHRLAASTLGLAALDSEVRAHFDLGAQLFQVIEHAVAPGDPFHGRLIAEVETPRQRVLWRTNAGERPRGPVMLQRDPPDTTIATGERLFLLSLRTPGEPELSGEDAPDLSLVVRRATRRLANGLRERGFRPTSQAGRVALAGFAAIASLLVVALVFFRHAQPTTSFGDALRTSLLVLLSNGHLADVFQQYDSLPPSLRWAEVVLSVSGTVLTAVLYALLTNSLLSARFQLLSRRPDLPSRGHVIVAGLGRTGRQTAAFLSQLHVPAVAIERSPIEREVMPDLPLIRANATEPDTFVRARIASADGVVAATSDDLVNVEIALLARKLNPECGMVVRLLDERLVDSVQAVLPDAQVLCVASLAATAFAAAALGEHVINVFRLEGTPVLVTEYLIDDVDTLHGRFLWEVAEGYAVVPVLYQHGAGEAQLCGGDEQLARLHPGDRLVVLATASSLEAIERGDLLPREHELSVERLLPFAEELLVAGVLARNFGYSLHEARSMLRDFPKTLPERLYAAHALHTKHLLEASGVQVRLRKVRDRPGEGEWIAPLLEAESSPSNPAHG